MHGVFEHRLEVSPREIDELNHVNNMRYFAWLTAAAWKHSVAQGWPQERVTDLGLAWVLRSQAIEYLKPAIVGDAILVRTWVADMKKTRTRREFRVIRESDKALIATANMVYAMVGLSRGLPSAIPPELAEAFVIVSGEPRT